MYPIFYIKIIFLNYIKIDYITKKQEDLNISLIEAFSDGDLEAAKKLIDNGATIDEETINAAKAKCNTDIVIILEQ